MLGFRMVEWQSYFEGYSIFIWWAILSQTIPNHKEKMWFLNLVYKMAVIFRITLRKKRFTKMFGIQMFRIQVPTVLTLCDIFWSNAKQKQRRKNLKQKHANHDLR